MRRGPVLIIDDERRMADSLRDLLAAEGYSVETAYGGAAGMEAVSRRDYPVVLTDLRMPGADGLAVVRHVRERRPATLVVVITGYATTESAIEAVHQGVFDYVRKPFEFERIKEVVERAFRRIEVDQLRADTAAMITHDVKIPLTSILGFAAMLRDRETGAFHPKAAEYLETIRSNGNKILALIDNYLTGCKVEAGTLRIQPRAVRLERFAEELREMYGPEAARWDAALEFHHSGEPATAWFDEPLVFRAAGNLLLNAIRHGEKSGPVILRIRPAGRGDEPRVMIEVENPAPGLRPGDLGGLFTRYQRSPGGGGVEGSGIGLYVVDAAARAHGGEAGAECLPGGRVRFFLGLPVHPHEDAHAEESRP